MSENENQDSSKRFKTCDDDSPAPWSDLNHDILSSVMMQLGVFDFPAFSGVCKSWRSFAVSNKNTFMASRPSMSLSIPTESNEEDYFCYLEDIEGRSFTSILPHSACMTSVGFTCGHLILHGKESNDFWLLNPVTRHGVHFPDIPSSVGDTPKRFKGVLVFSPSKSGWVFVMADGSTNIWYSIAGEGTWNHVSSTSPIVDLQAFKGKMYAIDNARHLYELTFNSEPKLTLLETKNFPASQQLFSSLESLYMMTYSSQGYYKVHKLDFEEMNWVSIRRTRKAGASSHVKVMHSDAAVKDGKGKVYFLKHMVIPHDRLNDDLKDG